MKSWANVLNKEENMIENMRAQHYNYVTSIGRESGSQSPRGLMRGSTATHFLGLRIRIPPGAWMSVYCECCLLSGRGLCVGLITRPEESHRLWCV